jgi:hypothetical protein
MLSHSKRHSMEGQETPRREQGAEVSPDGKLGGSGSVPPAYALFLPVTAKETGMMYRE